MSNRLKRVEKENREKELRDKISKSFNRINNNVEDFIKGIFSWGVYIDLENLEEFMKKVYSKCPKLMEPRYVSGLKTLFYISPWLNSIESWTPSGKAKDTIFYSLINHLIVKYSTPKFLYKIFFSKEKENKKYGELFKYIAQGGSLAKISSEFLPTPLTKKMRAIFIKLPVETNGLIEGIRTAQIKNYGGTQTLLNTILSSYFGKNFQLNEKFWETVIRWLCNNPMLDRKHISPLIDYIHHCKNEDENFSMKGRSPLAMIRAMEDWHKALGAVKTARVNVYNTSGFLPDRFVYNENKNNIINQHIYTITEILNSRDLIREGRDLRHCVYSYAQSMANGIVSVWSLKKDGDRLITIEVRNETIVQARGFGNRLMDTFERSIIFKWAIKNNLEFSKYI